MKIKLTNLTLIAFIAVKSFSQENSTAIFGIVRSEKVPVADAHIINLNKKIGTISNKNGEFEISVAVNDTLLFSSIHEVDPLSRMIPRKGFPVFSPVVFDQSAFEEILEQAKLYQRLSEPIPFSGIRHFPAAFGRWHLNHTCNHRLCGGLWQIFAKG